MKHRVLVADPPWTFKDRLPGGGRGAAKHYSCLTLLEICTFDIPKLHDDAWLFLWRVGSQQHEALAVAKAWGFGAPTSEFVWVKPQMGMGHSVRNCHEVCLIFKRGKPKRKSASVRSWFEAPRTKHSEKPDELYRRIEQLTDGPYVELFARRKREGWLCLGDEL